MFKIYKISLFLSLFLLLTSLSIAQNIDQLIGEITWVTDQGGYYMLNTGQQKYALINLPRQAGQVQEGKYYVTGFSTIQADPLFTGPIPFQVTQMDYKGPLQNAQSNTQPVVQNGTLNTTGYIFYHTKGAAPTYVFSVLDVNQKPVFYAITNIPATPGQITEGLYQVTATINSSLQNPSGVGTPIVIQSINPAAQDTAGQQNQNGEKEYIGNVVFMPFNQGMGYYVLQTQDNQQYALLNLPQQEGKYQPGQYKVKGIAQPDMQSPQNIGIPMEVTAINLIMPLPGMDANMTDPMNLFQNDEDGEGDEEDSGNSEFFDSGTFDPTGGANNGTNGGGFDGGGFDSGGLDSGGDDGGW